MSKLILTATPKFDVQAEDGEGKPRRPTFEILAYTGAVLGVGGFFSPVIVDLSGLKASRPRIPILLDHDTSRIVGQTDDIAIDGAGVRISGTITGDDDDAMKVISHAKNGFEWQASIGANIVRREFLEAGKKTTVNGREVTGPLLIAREAHLVETSFVAIGADQKTSATVAASGTNGLHPGAKAMNFEQWLEAKGFDPAALSDQQKTILQAAYDAEIAAAKPKAKEEEKPKTSADLEKIFAGMEAEDRRKDEITDLAAEFGKDYPGRRAEIRDIANHAIEAGMSFDDFERQLNRMARRYPGVVARRGQSRPDAGLIEASLCRSGGLPDIEKHFDEKTLNASEAEFKNGLGLFDLFLMKAKENGYGGYSRGDVSEIMRAALRPSDSIRASSQFSTLSLPGILSNTAQKFAVSGFEMVDNSWMEVARKRSVPDLKSITSYNLTGSFKFSKIGPAGEIEHGTVGEETYTNQAHTYAKMFAITREHLLNDDLGILTTIPQELGKGGADAFNEVFWTEFLADANTFYTSGRGNVSTGGGSAFGFDGLKAAALKFSKQTGPNGRPLAMRPAILLVPPELEIAADEIMTGILVNTGGSNSAAQVSNANVWRNKYRVVVSPFLSDTSITGYSAAAWYLIADPNQLAVIEAVFLRGRQRPVVETADTDFNTLGTQMRAYWDFGVKKQEYRAAVRSAGS